MEGTQQVITIYCLRDAEGRVRYVGKTSQSLAARLGDHLSEARRSNKKFHRFNWLRSLSEPPTAEVIEWCLPMHWEDRERYWIALARDYGCGLVNSTPGGDGGAGKNPSPETRAKLSAARIGRKATPETRAKISAARLGKKATPEARACMRAAHLGKKATPEACAKNSAARLGRKVTPETRAKMSAVNIGKKLTPETCAKISAAQLGKYMSPETRARISATMLGKKRGPHK